MGHITLSIKDDTIASLRKDFDAFVRVSLKLDPQFATPSFEDFLRAKLLDNMVPLTEHAVQRMLQGGQYAWAKRTLDKEFPNVVEILMRQAETFGFGFASRSEWTPEELAKACHDWAAAIVSEAQGDAALVDPLAGQIKSAVHDIQTLEERMQTPAWRLAESLRQRVYEAKLACEMSVGSTAREKLGELRGLLRLGLAHGSFQKQEAQQIMEYLRLLKPEIFVEEPYDVFSRLAAWLRGIFMVATPPKAPATQNPPRQPQQRP
ncbi:hypothetical protein WJ59_10410 [Burkholderia gladioli]|jgi:hypothetical protein|uniref:DUF4088 domain-containing protein n=2 Tax=Burkholderia gladioli TaxID=28095 RepID=A0AB38TUL3_BURGA|nr:MULTISPECIES: DUF4088 family protein [Burkholderia]AEA59696.1 hypothetical protein bgla_1g10130 [Burkholderia gladioli BSR3]AYQ87670.1 DUF4088 family protein [Burkholderia gladioli]KAF1064570.1 hypothetical protein LvStA_03235 [Burkholderia gladioli]KGE10882.1 hypothetical protein LA03_08040 [Burkholderia gladioli]KKJ06937.1 hypothetical protein XF14_07870 [Burkholderia gladioli]